MIHWAGDIDAPDDARPTLRLLGAILALALALIGGGLPPLSIIGGLSAICLAQFAPAFMDGLKASRAGTQM